MYIWQEEQFHSQGIDIYTDVRSGNNIDVYLNKQKFLYFDNNGGIYQTIGNDFNGYKVTYGNITNDSINVYGIPYVNGQAMTNVSIGTFTYTGETMKAISKIKLGDETYKISDNDKQDIITDLSTIRTGASNGTTALSELNNKVDTTSELVSNNRFDGQWVQKFSQLSTSTAINTYTFDLKNYLPSDNYQYMVTVNLCAYRGSDDTGTIAIYSNIFPNTVTLSGSNYCCQLKVGGYGRTGNNTFEIPVGSLRTIYMNITVKAMSNLNLSLLGFRRIGTNE